MNIYQTIYLDIIKDQNKISQLKNLINQTKNLSKSMQNNIYRCIFNELKINNIITEDTQENPYTLQNLFNNLSSEQLNNVISEQLFNKLKNLINNAVNEHALTDQFKDVLYLKNKQIYNNALSNLQQIMKNANLSSFNANNLSGYRILVYNL